MNNEKAIGVLFNHFYAKRFGIQINKNNRVEINTT